MPLESSPVNLLDDDGRAMSDGPPTSCYPHQQDCFIAHFDLDCFYCQVEQLRLGIPWDTPCVVHQWGCLMAVNYAARSKGISRLTLLSDARQHYPDLVAIHTATYALGQTSYAYHPNPTKSTHMICLEPYRVASHAFHRLLQRMAGPRSTYQSAGGDEAYVEITAEVHERMHRSSSPSQVIFEGDSLSPSSTKYIDNPEDWPPELGKLLYDPTQSDKYNLQHYTCAARLVKSMRDALLEELHLRCSAGISSNKNLAKYVSAKHKPHQQTILLDSGIPAFMREMKIQNLRGFGGQFGTKIVETLKVETVNELWELGMESLYAHFGQTTAESIMICSRGFADSEVSQRKKPKSILSSKKMKPTAEIGPWLDILSTEIVDRVESFISSQLSPTRKGRDGGGEELSEIYPGRLTLSLQGYGSDTPNFTTTIPYPCAAKRGEEGVSENPQRIVNNVLKTCFEKTQSTLKTDPKKLYSYISVMAHGFDQKSQHKTPDGPTSRSEPTILALLRRKTPQVQDLTEDGEGMTTPRSMNPKTLRQCGNPLKGNRTHSSKLTPIVLTPLTPEYGPSTRHTHHSMLLTKKKDLRVAGLPQVIVID